jgi:AraC family transcriptional regulator
MTSTTTLLEPPRFVEGRRLLITGLRGRFTPATLRDIPILWEQWLPNAERVPNRAGRTDFGVSLAATPDGSGDGQEGAFDYVCGVEVSDFGGLPPGWAQITIPAQRCAVFEHRGHVTELCRTVRTIFREWLPSSGCAWRADPGGVLVFERYREDFDPKQGVGGMEVWLPMHEPHHHGQAGN